MGLVVLRHRGEPDDTVIDDAVRQLALTGYAIDRLQFVSTEETDLDLVGRVAKTHADFAAATTRVLQLLSTGRVAPMSAVGTQRREKARIRRVVLQSQNESCSWRCNQT